MCDIMDAYFELVTVTDSLESNIEDLKTIISKVNTKRKNRRDAKVLADNYATNVHLWNKTINKIIIDESKISEWAPLLKLARYPGMIKHIYEQELFNILSTYKTDRLDNTIFSAKKKVDINDMPGIVSNIEKIEEVVLKIDEWTNPLVREPLISQLPPVRPRIDPTPPRPEPKTNTNSSKKIIQRFRFQFKALAALVDDTYMAEAMLKALESMRNSLDKFDDLDFEVIEIDAARYNINETMIKWMKSIFKTKDKNKKREKKEERLKTDKMKRLLQYSMEFPTK